jgi:protein TonB
MNRLQKKCFIVSMGIHLLLVVVLLVGPAFLSGSSKSATPQLTFVAAATVDAAVSGGGDNTAKSPPAELTAPPAPPAQVVPPAPVPPPVAERTPPVPQIDKTPLPTPRNTPKEVKPPKPDAPVVDSNPRTHKIDVSTKLVTGTSPDVKAAQDAARKAAAAEKRRADAALGRALAGIRGGVSGSTEVKLKGPGGGGVPYANFISAVTTVYYNAWRQPNGVPNVTVEVSVIIARDGTVISARIVTPSGNSAVDKSVQETIDRVKFLAPLPEDSTDERREVPVNFSTQSTTIG